MDSSLRKHKEELAFSAHIGGLRRELTLAVAVDLFGTPLITSFVVVAEAKAIRAEMKDAPDVGEDRLISNPGADGLQTARKPNSVLDDHSSTRHITAPL